MNNILLAFVVWLCLAPFPHLYAGEHPEATQKLIDKILADMRHDLSLGNTEKARNSLQSAADNFHSVELELGLIQPLMQAGLYRNALSAAAHTQAEHPANSDATILYAWLLAIGGQIKPAIQLLSKNQQEHPQIKAVAHLLNQCQTAKFSTAPIASEVIQLRPYTPTQSIVPPSSRYVSTGVIIDNGKRLLAPLKAVEQARVLKARTSLGHELSLHIEKKITHANVAILKLDKPILLKRPLAVENKKTYPGTPIYIIGFTASDNRQAAWPLLKVDILGTPATDTLAYPIHLTDAAMGSPILNQRGNLIGIVNGASDMVLLNDGIITTGQAGDHISSLNETIDGLYEKALGNTVQILSGD